MKIELLLYQRFSTRPYFGADATETYLRVHSGQNGGKLPGNSKNFFKKSKDKAVPGKRSFKR